MPASHSRVQSDDIGESIVVQAESAEDLRVSSPLRATRPEVVIRMESHSDDVGDKDDFEKRVSTEARPHLSIPKSWNSVRDSTFERPSDQEATKPRKSLPGQETRPGEPSRGRKRKALSDEDRQRANLVRRLGACDNCRRRKLACSPSHERGEGHALRLALATYQKPEKPTNAAEPRVSRKDVARNHRASIRSGDASEYAAFSGSHAFTFHVDPDSISDVEIRTRHANLQKFGQSLTRAARSTFPITSPSMYTSVHVLLLRWQDDDTGVSKEAERLAEVFLNLYHFEVTVGLIPSDSPSRWLSRKILNFVELDDDSRQTLKIVCYGGHSFISETKQCMWSNDRRFSSTVSWQGCQSLLEEAQSDVLILLDACGVGNASSSVGNGATEVITAGGWYGAALPEVGPFSFTTTLTAELRQLSTREFFTIDQLYQQMLARIQSQLSSDDEKRRYPTPYHFISKKDTSLTQSITLCPLQDSLLPGRSGGRDTRTPGRKSSDDLHPGMALTVKFKDSYDPSDLATDNFMEWLRAIPLPAEAMNVEAGYAKF
ncbi:uncharacterized protein LY89DRAFT_677747 [Mollisia scopiformis]|uniref:Uncharacterized protein n=1 Tax=Mollisia scopiformis TaxID=149040 RepID=A0A132B534_MOLSC|nr:uncharacterized protein LY89DRAFT_677747 [Mollisia scopiformis]KUJ07520.1 hypothetical protein LY89DRAFT_677747 [Mollisia scopiformis]